MAPSRKCFPPSVGSTFSIFVNFHVIAIDMHIAVAIFKKVLPALGGEHILDFSRCSEHRKRYANQNPLHFLRFRVPVEVSWGRLGIILSQLSASMGRLGANLGPTLANLGPTWANLGPAWPQLVPTWRQSWPS